MVFLTSTPMKLQNSTNFFNNDNIVVTGTFHEKECDFVILILRLLTIIKIHSIISLDTLLK